MGRVAKVLLMLVVVVQESGRELDVELRESVRRGERERVVELLALGANPDARGDSWRETALMLAAEKDAAEIVQILLQAGADVEARDGSNATVIMWAISSDSINSLAALIDAGANVRDFQGALGRNPLLAALAYGHERVVAILLKADVDVNAQGGEIAVMSPLMLAAARGLRESVGLLVEAGATVNALSEAHKKTALDYAIEEGHTDVATFLRSHGAKRAAAIRLERSNFEMERPVAYPSYDGGAEMRLPRLRGASCLGHRPGHAAHFGWL
jgi:ankyrin repeat protein